MADDGLKDWIIETLSPLGHVRTRRMFGGNGVNIDGLNFAFFGDGELYLKVDDLSRQRFLDAGLKAFVYEMKGRPMAMSYHEAPPEFYDDADAALDWGRQALDAARRAALKKPVKSKK